MIPEEKKALFLIEFAKDFNIGSACKRIGVSRNLFYDWCKADEEFNKAQKDVRMTIADKAEQALSSLIDEKNAQATIFALKTLGKSRGYKEDSNIDITTGGNPFNTQINIIKDNDEN